MSFSHFQRNGNPIQTTGEISTHHPGTHDTYSIFFAASSYFHTIISRSLEAFFCFFDAYFPPFFGEAILRADDFVWRLSIFLDEWVSVEVAFGVSRWNCAVSSLQCAEFPLWPSNTSLVDISLCNMKSPTIKVSSNSKTSSDCVPSTSSYTSSSSHSPFGDQHSSLISTKPTTSATRYL